MMRADRSLTIRSLSLDCPRVVAALGIALVLASAPACGDDPPPPPPVSEAVRFGVGSACTTSADCEHPDLECLPFKGGYCGLQGCDGDEDCLEGSACVTHTDGDNYCFLLCVDKPDCNLNRPFEDEANCVGSVDFVDNGHHKACEPPSG